MGILKIALLGIGLSMMVPQTGLARQPYSEGNVKDNLRQKKHKKT